MLSFRRQLAGSGDLIYLKQSMIRRLDVVMPLFELFSIFHNSNSQTDERHQHRFFRRRTPISATIMKVLALLCSLFAIVSASTKPTFVAKSRALDIRGGAAIGPLDEDLAVQLVKAGATAYVAGAGSKFIADKTGASGSQLADFVTTDLFALNALCAAFAAGMYGLGDTGFGTLKAYVLAKGLALTLKVLDGGAENIVDTLMDNKVMTVSVLAGLYIVYG